MSNPLLSAAELPPFSTIRPEHVEPAIRSAIDGNREKLAALLDAQASTWDDLVVPVEAMQHALARTWSPVGHLNAVLNSEELRAAYNTCLPLLAAWNTELAQNERLYRAYSTVRQNEGAARDPAELKLLDNALRDFRLGGVGLPPEQKSRFKSLMERLSSLHAKFDENVLDATNAWSRHITEESHLSGLPATVMDRARNAATEAGLDGWLFSLDGPNYQAVLMHAEREALRRDFYEAWCTRASDQGPHAGRFDNGPVMTEILAVRRELAALVGFESFAEYSLATKMAACATEVLGFLDELASVSRPAALRELLELEAYAGRPLEAWDVSFFAERLKRERFAISEEELRPYFPLPRVLDGLFKVAERLYGIRVTERSGIDAYHPDVRLFDVIEADGTCRGRFFLDPHARANKRGGAWMDECVGRKRLAGSHALPVAYLVCNFMPPVRDRPSLLTHHEVLTLFHEFGHGLHHMLTRVDLPSIAGINGVPWDAVELPSQFMENFAWRPEVLPLISGHVETGEPLPEAELGRLLGSRTFHAGLQTVRQLEFALFDFRLHVGPVPPSASAVLETLDAVRREVAVVRPPAFNRFPHSFQHVFSGGYAAGYYSYKWAEVLAADAFSAFEESGVFDSAVARRFLTSVLERGGSRDAMEAFIEFRGRRPMIEPLLRQLGLAA